MERLGTVPPRGRGLSCGRVGRGGGVAESHRRSSASMFWCGREAAGEGIFLSSLTCAAGTCLVLVVRDPCRTCLKGPLRCRIHLGSVLQDGLSRRSTLSCFVWRRFSQSSLDFCPFLFCDRRSMVLKKTTFQSCWCWLPSLRPPTGPLCGDSF